MPGISKGARLRELMNRKDKVLTVLHPPTAAHARIMERAGCEVGFVGTGGVVGACTGLADVSVALKGPGKKGQASIVTRTTTSPPPGETHGVRDSDTLKLRCLPPE